MTGKWDEYIRGSKSLSAKPVKKRKPAKKRVNRKRSK